MWQMNKQLFFWIKLMRTCGKSGSHQFYSCTGTDSETTGWFNDSVTRVGFITVYPGQDEEQVSKAYRDQVFREAEQLGFTNNLIVKLTRREYSSFEKHESIEHEYFVEQFCAPAYMGKRMVKR